MKLSKRNRQNLIKKLIETQDISTQTELLGALKKEGVSFNQPTISRDLRELSVIKAARGLGKIVYQLPVDTDTITMNEFRHKFINLVNDIQHTGNLILVKALPGEAQGIAKAIDSARLKQIIGTIAGDDTILVVVDKVTNVKKVFSLFERLKQGLNF
ncbi:arginine repressor [candidate division WOR-3 bacterium RBG_13_43_14]|uniref:Arginine repressor n=1 Tax=candidate division WOR-3 bacterium RBG_13_43_14 TaxID=1802590 RepID=A0A1F4UFQ3_UNCW3|nr:MAG: arginine repressor [candidate division WOR-3 bacterium RBG_13_43_14]